MSSLNSNKKERTRDLIAAAKKNESFSKAVPTILLIVTSLTILATFGIIYTLLIETVTFFKEIKILDFLFGTVWNPFSNVSPTYGVLPLVIGTLKIAGIAIVFALPIGLACAIYLS